MATNRNANASDQVSRAVDAGRESFNAAAEGTQRFTEQVSQIFNFSTARGEELTRQSAQNLEAATEAGTALTRDQRRAVAGRHDHGSQQDQLQAHGCFPHHHSE